MLWIIQIVSVMAIIGLAPLIWGIAQKTKAHFQGRQGPSLLQPYQIFAKTWNKETVVPEGSSWVFRLSPSVNVATLIVIAASIPWAGQVPTNWPHNVLSVFFLLGLERFSVALAGLDSATTFGGLGASRIATIGSGVEPAMLAAFGVLWVVSRHTQIETVAPFFANASPSGFLPWGLAVLSYLFIVIAETGRLPVDNPDTHLELTMMHEATLLEYSGRLLAQEQLAMAMKFTIIIGLGWVWLGPVGPSPWVNVLLHVAEIGSSAMVLAWMESRFVKLRYFHLPRYFTLGAGIGLLGFYLAMSGGVR
ncbi:respiratory chain complex I subunit 1 family protein [Sulfobacillus thermosulfidooxidans]|uniref:respiratory chain complex I subunit 1 family protein n=1 Tax=Sulfobacillus thermosulfidooxidans TaxID=28034 RepID=UPI0006B4B0F5|nr:NADH-quinone oxidoreductase subunit H [Sulfobacillus thermosulfidooxidans]